MDALTQQLMQLLSGGGVSQISQKIGADERTTESALSTAMSLLVSALARNASEPRGAAALHQALAEDHDGSILENLPGFLENPDTDEGAAILKHVLGPQRPAVEQQLAQGIGLQGDQVGQLLEIAAPLLMGALGQQQHQTGLDVNGLTSFLGAQQQQVQQSSPDLISMLNTLLDTNRSGSALDEILGFLGKLFGGR